jgi:uncharacterized protein (TIGR02466 family)|tara:strand:+ start:82 stop:663 length:582 start_codon:yes stop_codon:yes gene_type:complete
MIHNIFQVPVYQNELKIDNQSLSKYCIQLSHKEKGRTISNIGGWQSNYFKENNNSMLIKNLWPNVKKHAIQFGKKINVDVKGNLGSLWVNVNGYKDTNSLHHHPDCLVSGVYYIKTHEDCGNIRFYHPCHLLLSQDWKNMKHIPNEYNSYNSATWWYPSIEGMLYLFPSWLLHAVEPNLSKREKRISVSFNIS